MGNAVVTLTDEITHYLQIVAALRDEGLEPTWLTEAHAAPVLMCDSEWTADRTGVVSRPDIVAGAMYALGYPTP
mgnify:CR=1 FL=1